MPSAFENIRNTFLEHPTIESSEQDFPSDMVEGFRQTQLIYFREKIDDSILIPQLRKLRIQSMQDGLDEELRFELSFFLRENELLRREPFIGPVREKVWQNLPIHVPVLWGQIASFAIPEIIHEAKVRSPIRYEESTIENNFNTVLHRLSQMLQQEKWKQAGNHSTGAQLGHVIGSVHKKRENYNDPTRVRERISDIAFAYQMYEIMRAGEAVLLHWYDIDLTQEEKNWHYVLFRETLYSGNYRFPMQRSAMETIANTIDTTVADFITDPTRFLQSLDVVGRFYRHFGSANAHLIRDFLRPNTQAIFEAAIK